MRPATSFRRPDRDKAEPDACGLLALSKPDVPGEERYAAGAEQTEGVNAARFGSPLLYGWPPMVSSSSGRQPDRGHNDGVR